MQTLERIWWVGIAYEVSDRFLEEQIRILLHESHVLSV